MNRFFAILTLLVAVNPAAAQTNAPREETQDGDKIRQRQANFASKIWWNQPKKIEDLGLSTEQRKKMDAHLFAYMDNRRENNTPPSVAQDGLLSALVEGDPAAAREHGEVLAEAAAAPVRGQIELMIQVTSEMTPAQRQKMAKNYPRMLSRPWIRSFGAGRASGRASN